MEDKINVNVGDEVIVKAWNQLEMCFKCNRRKVKSVSHIAPNGDYDSSMWWIYCDNGGAYDSRFVSVVKYANKDK